MDLLGGCRIFLSFDPRDAELALQMQHDLRVEGIPTATRDDVPPEQSLSDFIAQASALVLVMSRASLLNSQVSDETERALSAGRGVVMALVEDTPLPPQLAVVHCVDFRGDWSLGIDELVGQLTTPHAAPVPNLTSTQPYVISEQFSLGPSTPSPGPLVADRKSGSRSAREDLRRRSQQALAETRKAHTMSRRLRLSLAGLGALAAVGFVSFGTSLVLESRNLNTQTMGAAQRGEASDPLASENRGDEMIQAYLTQTNNRRGKLASSTAWESAKNSFHARLAKETLSEGERADLKARIQFCRSRIQSLGVSADRPHQAKRQLSEAAAILRGAISTAPGWAAPHIELADLLLRLGDAEIALEQTQAAKQLAPSSWLAMTVNAQALLALNNPARATSELQRALELAPNAPDILAQMAMAYHLLDDKQEQARSLAERALSADPKLALAHLILAEQALAASDWVEAREHAARAASLSPLDSAAWMALGDAQARAADSADDGRLAEATMAYRRSLELVESLGEGRVSGHRIARTAAWLEGAASRNAVALESQADADEKKKKKKKKKKQPLSDTSPTANASSGTTEGLAAPTASSTFTNVRPPPVARNRKKLPVATSSASSRPVRAPAKVQRTPSRPVSSATQRAPVPAP